MRILHVNDLDPDGAFGGAEVYIARLMTAQRLRGDVVEAHFPDLPSRNPLLDLWNPGTPRRLRDHVTAFGPDVIHVHGFLRELSPSVLLPTGIPTVVTVHDLRLHGGSEHQLPSARAIAGRLWVEPVARRLLRRVAATSGVSDVVARALADDGHPHPAVLRVPVPAPVVPLTPAGDCQDVLFAGRLSPDKGAPVLLEAFRRLGDRFPATTLLLAGDGPLRGELTAAAGPRVRLLGHLTPEEVSGTMSRVRVVVVPSQPTLRREGSSLTTVEAARHGRPVVCSDDPAVVEVARRVGGDIVGAQDVAGLTARLEHWLSEPAAATAVGRQAVASSSDHDPAAVATAADALYRAALR